MRALIVEDDRTLADLAASLLQADDFDVDIADINRDLQDQIRAQSYDIIIIDIMMPKVDGLELCRRIKSDAGLSAVKVAMMTAKAYDFDKRRAKQFGADGYITKPIDVNAFASNIRAIVEASFSVTYWGVRGTLPVPGPHALKYGGNTSCVTMALPNDRVLIFDAGSGIKSFSEHVMKNRGGKISAHMFISHPHWDHINAFPYFDPFYVPGNKFEVIGAKHGERTMESLLSAQMDDVFFPIMVTDMAASITFRDIGEETITIDDDITVQSMLLSHPGNCLGYRVTFGGKSVCYVTDNELYTKESGFQNESYEQKLIKFIKHADILITDTTYFDEEYESKVHWGHSSVGRVVEVAAAAGVERLHLFHHDPSQSDDDIDRKLEVAQDMMAAFESVAKVEAPAEGATYKP